MPAPALAHRFAGRVSTSSSAVICAQEFRRPHRGRVNVHTVCKCVAQAFHAEEVIEQARVQKNHLEESGSPDPHRISPVEIGAQALTTKVMQADSIG
jgi:hypothetical protein